jgi:hypothetical protein
MDCKLCGARMTREDQMVDPQFCLSCINHTDGSDEIMHHTKSYRGTVAVYKQGTSFYVTHTALDYGTDEVLYSTSRHDTDTEALNRYQDMIREWL